MESTSPFPFLSFTFFITMLGGYIPTVRMWNPAHFQFLISFCLGNLIGAVLFHMIPKIMPVWGVEMVLAMFVGFLITFCVEKVFGRNILKRDQFSYQSIGFSALAGLSLHSLVEGFAMGMALKMHFGTLVIISIVIHKFPVALTLSSLFQKAGKFNNRIILLIVFLFALTTPVGALLSYGIFERVDYTWLSVAIAASAGTFIYLAFFDFLPAITRRGHFRMAHAFSACLGGIAMYCLQG